MGMSNTDTKLWGWEDKSWRREDGVTLVQWTDRSGWRGYRPIVDGMEVCDFEADNVFEAMMMLDRRWCSSDG